MLSASKTDNSTTTIVLTSRFIRAIMSPIWLIGRAIVSVSLLICPFKRNSADVASASLQSSE